MTELKPIHVSLYSGGASSAWVAKYIVEKYGAENCVLLHTDTKWEDADCYRFMDEVADKLGVEITFHNDGRTPADIFREDLYFGNFGTAPCSKKLKMNQTFEYVQEMISAGYLPILYFGIDYKEARRAPRIAYNYKHNVDIFEDGVETRFPLIGEVNGTAINGAQLLNGTNYLEKGEMPRMTNPIVHDCIASLVGFTSAEHIDSKAELIEWGVTLPRMYDMGFSHANCGGICVKAGKRHYKTLYETMPERFAEMEALEQEINDAQIAKNGRRYTILSRKDADGKKTPYSLKEYRVLELEAGQCNLDDDGAAPCECVF